jgi:hypothetical protein
MAAAELDGGHQRHLDVAVLERMILDQMGTQDGGFRGERRVEVLAGELGGRRMQGRIGQVEIGFLGDLLGRRLQDGFGDEKEVGQLGVVDHHRPRRSSAR